MRPSVLTAITIMTAASLYVNGQDCNKLMKKEKDGTLSTKDQQFDLVMTESHKFAFLNQGGQFYLEYFETNRSTVHGGLYDAMSDAAFIDTIRIDLQFSNRKEVTFKFDSSDKKIKGFNLKSHYYLPLTEEQLELFKSSQIKNYKLLRYQGNRSEKLDDKKWKPVKPKDSLDIMQAARCIDRSIK